METLMRTRLLETFVTSLVAVLVCAACGGSGGGAPPPPPATSVTQTIDAATGGTINGPGGIVLTIPPDALAADTAITIAQDDSGAPPVPDVLGPLDGPMIALLPHGTTFSVPVTLSMPAAATPELQIYKTNEQRDGWQALVPVQSAGRVEAAITSFSNIARTLPPCSPCGCSAPSPLPRIIGEPRDSFTLSEGGFWIFRVDVVACAPYTFRWLRNGSFLVAETNQDILLDPVAFADNGARYSVMVTDAAGRAVTSRAALLTVNAAVPTIVNQPVDLQVVAGANALFSAASTSSIAQTLQWKRCAAAAVCPPSTAAWPDANETSTQLTLPGVTLPNSGDRVAMCASNAAGTTCSNTATLSVVAAPVQPVIVRPPQALSVAAGTSASFTVLATGGSLAYEWQGSRDGVNFTPEARCPDSAACTLSNVALTDDGLQLRVRAFNGAGQAISDPPALLTVRLVVGVALTRVGGGHFHSVALKGNGRLFAWGANNRGQLGDGTTDERTAPQQVGTLDQVATFAVGADHALALRSDGSVWAWGDGGAGRLGVGDDLDRSTATAVPALPVSRGVAAGLAHSLAVGADSSIWGWGVNGCGQLGDGTVQVRLLATRAATLTGAVSAAAGVQHSLAVHSNGSVWAWGCNGYGQLGDGTTTARLMPTPIGGITQAVAVAAGRSHSLALSAAGSVYAWGWNSSGQLGDGATTERRAPVRVALPGVAVAVAAGRNHSLALLADGRVFAWGENTFGQIGNGTSLDVLVPSQVGAPLPAAIVSIGAGVDAEHSFALDANGVVWAWGRNDARQLADGTQLIRERPVQAIGLNLN
jgi:alpha-tubulin suppressor-like RCC1 family protein